VGTVINIAMRGEGGKQMGSSKRVFNAITASIKYRKAVGKLSGLPVSKSITRWVLSPKNANFSYVPIYEDIGMPEGTVVPLSIIEHFIEEACHYVILPQCICRRVNDCEDFDADIGCIFLGEAAKGINREIGRHVTKEEALEHIHKAYDAGLTPMLGHAIFDAAALGVRPHTRLISVCQCCPCCCMMAAFPYAGPEMRGFFHRLEGVTVEITDACDGCGECVETCIWQNIEMVAGKAVMGDACKGCTRCAMICPIDAVKVTIDNPDFIEDGIARVSSWVDAT
jgi:NAD-dependent dihydropyrimidine dehydrogenase PreA subunit